MTRSDYILKTKPNYLFISFSIVCAVGAAYIGYLIWASNKDIHGADEKTGYVIAMIFSGFLWFLQSCSFGVLLGWKYAI
jgi:hypothetical protein